MTLSDLPFLWRHSARNRVQTNSKRLPAANTLAQVRPGRKAKILKFSPGLQGSRRAQMQAYGLTPGFVVRVVQHNPVTIVQIEHLEMAIETELAQQILVEEIAS